MFLRCSYIRKTVEKTRAPRFRGVHVQIRLAREHPMTRRALVFAIVYLIIMSQQRRLKFEVLAAIATIKNLPILLWYVSDGLLGWLRGGGLH